MQKNLPQIEQLWQKIPQTIIAVFETNITQLKMQNLPISISTQYNEQILTKILIQLLQQTINSQLIKQYKFQFIIQGQILRGKIKSHLIRFNINCQKTIPIQYVIAFNQLNQQNNFQEDDWISSLCNIMSIDSYPFAASLFNGGVSFYNSQGKIFYKQKIQEQPIKSLKVLPTQKQGYYYLISGGLDQKIQIHGFDLKQKSNFNLISNTQNLGPITSIDCNPLLDGLFCSVGDKYLNIWKIPQLYYINTHNSVKINTKKRHLNEQNLSNIVKQQFNNTIINTVHWSTNNQIIIGCMNHKIQIINVQKVQSQNTILTKDSITTSIDTNNNKIITSHQDGYIRLWDYRDLNQPTNTYKSHSKYISQVQYNRNSNIFASCSYDQTVKIWDSRSIYPLQTLTGNTDKIFTILWLNQKQLVSGGSQSKIILYSI